MCQDSLFTQDLKLQFDLIPFLFTFRGMFAKKRPRKKAADSLSSASQVIERVGGHSPVQALQQTPGVRSDETSAWVSSQTRYVCRPTAVFL